MIKTRFTDLMGIDHPVALAGMSGSTSPELVAAVSNAGGLGIYGASSDAPDVLARNVAAVREKTERPFGLNVLLAFMDEEEIRAAVDAQPAVLSTAWPRDNQDLAAIFGMAHERGIKVLHMVPTANDAIKAAQAGADVIIAQGTDAGGHIGLIGTVVIVPRSLGRWRRFQFWRRVGSATGAALRPCLRLARREFSSALGSLLRPSHPHMTR